MKGLVLKSTGSFYQVQTDEGVVECRIKGKLRMKGLVTTNPVAVGDWVLWEYEEGGRGLIIDVIPRRNYLIRKSTNLSKQAHVVAANIDLAVLVVTLAAPPTSAGFIDRFLVTCEAYGIEPLLVYNKIDLFDSPEALQLVNDNRSLYENLGYATLACSAWGGNNMEELKERLRHKVAMFSGHSGVGKSSLLKALYPNLEVRIGEISMSHLKGQHTTTFAEMHPVAENTYLIDTPGIKGLGLVDIEKDELALYFPEMKALLEDCRFYNCKHLNEPGCAVKAALDAGAIAPTRYASYQAIMNDDEGPYR